MGGDHVRRKRGVHFLKDNGNNVIANVALALELLLIAFHKWKQSRYVKHDLVPLVLFIKGMRPRLSMTSIKASTVTSMLAKSHSLTQKL